MNYLQNKLFDSSSEIKSIIFKEYINLIKEDTLSKEIKQNVLIYLSNNIDKFSKDELDKIYSLISDVEVLILAPPELQSIIILKNLEIIKTSINKKNVQTALLNLSRISSNNINIYSDKIIDIHFDFFENPDLFAINNSNIALEIKKEILGQFCYLIVNFILKSQNNEYLINRFINIINNNSHIKKDLIERLISFKHKISNEKLIKLIEYELNSILPKSPNYDFILSDNKIIFRLYFLSEEFFVQWQNSILGKPNLNGLNKFEYKVKKINNYYIYTKIINGIEIELQIKEPGKNKKSFENNVFQTINDKNIDGILYFGHAGGGNELAQSIAKAPKYQINEELNKIIILCACSSASYYGPSVKKLYPNSHFFANKTTTYGVDDSYFFDTLLNGMCFRKNYIQIKNELFELFSKFEYTKSEKNIKDGIHNSINLIWPNEEESLKYRDSDGDGLVDYRDNVYNLDVDNLGVEEDIVFDIGGAINLPQRSLLPVQSFLNGRFVGKLTPFGDLRIPEKENNIGWFNKYSGEFAERLGREDIGDEVVKISNVKKSTNIYNQDFYYFEFEISAAYKKSSNRVLKALTGYELTDYFLKNYDVINDVPVLKEKPLSKLVGDDNYYPFLKAIDNLMHEYHSATPEYKREIRPQLELIYLRVREHYNISDKISFEDAYIWSWSKKWFGNVQEWQGDELLRPFIENYNLIVNDVSLFKKKLKELKRENKNLYEKIKNKDNETIIQYLASKDIITKVEKLLN